MLYLLDILKKRSTHFYFGRFDGRREVDDGHAFELNGTAVPGFVGGQFGTSLFSGIATSPNNSDKLKSG